MKVINSILMAVIFFTGCDSSTNIEAEINSIKKEITYDSALAIQYGADEYGMKSYVMAFLKAGPNRDEDSTQAQEIFVAHMKNIDRMAENGDLILAGPFFDSGDMKGIYIFNVSSIEEAEELTNSDPAIKSGYLRMELHQWYGSAALMGVNDVHTKIAKTSVID